MLASIISKDPIADALNREVAREMVERLRSNTLFNSARTLLYDQFGRPLPRVTADPKVGDTIRVKVPQRWLDYRRS